MDVPRANAIARLSIALLIGFLTLATTVSAATITVDTLTDENDGVGVGGISLRDAINEANSNGQDDTIDFSVTGTITLTADLPAITTNVDIQGPGRTSLIIDGADLYRVFIVMGSGTNVTISDLSVANARAKGGNGGGTITGGGGGGAAGMGAALFINDGFVRLDTVACADNEAIGGIGGVSSGNFSSGAGGGGVGANGTHGGGGGGGFLGGSGGGLNANGGEGAGGGGGAGGCHCPGKLGGFGGGGGGGGEGDFSFDNGDGGIGGDGGFGGGGGGAGDNDLVMTAPAGGNGGTHGGDGGSGSSSSQGYGGGGAGLGGAIFIRAGTLELIDCEFYRNTATGGSAGGGDATDGEGKGGAIYIRSGATVREINSDYGSGADANIASDDGATSGDDDDAFGTIAAIPVVQSMTQQSVNPSNASQVTYFVTFSEAVTGVNAADFSVIASGVMGASVDASILDVGSGAIYAVTINTGSGSGTVQLKLVDDDSITNGSSVKLGGTGTGNGDFTASVVYTIDRGTPRALTSGAITRNSANPTKASQVTFLVAFDEAVTGVDTSDFTIDASGLTGATVTGVTDQGGGNFLVSVNTGGGEGSLSIDLIDNDSIKDAALNPLGGAGSGNGAVTNGEVYTVDLVRPAVTVEPSLPGPTNADTLNFTVTFDEDVSDFDDTDDVSIEHDGTAHKGVAITKQSDTAYDVTLSGVTGDGELVLYVKANAASDSIGNKNTISAASEAVVIDNTAPVVDSLDAPEGLNESNELVVTITFSEAVTGLSSEDITLNHDGTAHESITIEADSETTYRVIVAGVSGTGTISATLAANAVTDAAGNGAAAATIANVSLEDGANTGGTGPGGPLCGAATTPLLGLTAMSVIGWRIRKRRSLLIR
ncbi:MAG TPA: Ig-like domain-containing protein [Phycisphaerae bacterium]|nr:Ig-like domain-containing protein [Phycisphaerae bacterium]HRW53640.1 Ig-like domain-containing protein [Phycisphaerae bacterium]